MDGKDNLTYEKRLENPDFQIIFDTLTAHGWSEGPKYERRGSFDFEWGSLEMTLSKSEKKPSSNILFKIWKFHNWKVKLKQKCL